MSNNRRLKRRQNSWSAWDSRVTAPSVKLDLHLACRKLPKKDSFSHADAFCGIWEAPPTIHKDKGMTRLPSKQEREVGRTEVVRATEHPDFANSQFRLEFRFQEQQTYVIRVYDEDLKYATDLKEHDFVGGCVFTLGELMGAAGCTIAKPILTTSGNPTSSKAFCVLTGHEIVETREVLEFRFSGQDLGLNSSENRKGLGGKPMGAVAGGVADALKELDRGVTSALGEFDTYFKLEKLQTEDQSWTVVWKSEVVRETHLSPTWEAARIPLQLLCDDNPNSPLKITIWQWNRITHDDLVGFVETKVSEMVLQARRGIPVLDVMLEKRKIFGGTKLKKAGVLKVLKASILNIPSMLQYLSGGCNMDLMVAIDCTKVNGNWRKQKSLHYSSDAWLNDYQAALLKVGSIFDGYTNQQGYILWGYGGYLKGPNAEAPYFTMGEEIRGADNLVKAYDKVFSPDNTSLVLGEEGRLQNIIQAAMFRATNANKGGTENGKGAKQCYATLVILTTGSIADVSDCIDTICAAAEDAPLSIALIGIGPGDFDAAHALTVDPKSGGKLHDSNGVPISRDMVQFCDLGDFHGNARECVAEAFRDVPEQFVQYFMNSGAQPLPPKAVPEFTTSTVFGKSGSKSSSSSSSGGGGKSSSTSSSKKKKERSSARSSSRARPRERSTSRARSSKQ